MWKKSINFLKWYFVLMICRLVVMHYCFLSSWCKMICSHILRNGQTVMNPAGSFDVFPSEHILCTSKTLAYLQIFFLKIFLLQIYFLQIYFLQIFLLQIYFLQIYCLQIYFLQKMPETDWISRRGPFEKAIDTTAISSLFGPLHPAIQDHKRNICFKEVSKAGGCWTNVFCL